MESIGILVDTREKSNEHITEIYDKNDVLYKVQKLDFGDYSFYIPANKKLDILDDISFENYISVERKSGINELAGNFTSGRKRFENIYSRHKGKMILMIEGDSYGDICSHNYRSQLKPMSFIGTLHSWEHRYNVPFIFIEKPYAPLYIYNTFKYWLRIYLEQNNDIQI